jgi:TRAP-type C4-dicarboxylate transport system substrate-binding protein
VEALGMKVIKVMDGGLRFLVTVRPVKTLADMKGIKFRTAQNQMHMDIFSALGASPTPMAYGEIYTGLQNKVIDGCENDIFGITSMKFYEVAKNVTLTGHFSWPMALVISKKTWDNIPEADREIFVKAGEAALKSNNKILMESQDKLLKQIIDAKTNIIDLSPEERAKFRKAVQPVYDKYATDQTAKDFVAAVEKLRQQK